MATTIIEKYLISDGMIHLCRLGTVYYVFRYGDDTVDVWPELSEGEALDRVADIIRGDVLEI